MPLRRRAGYGRLYAERKRAKIAREAEERTQAKIVARQAAPPPKPAGDDDPDSDDEAPSSAGGSKDSDDEEENRGQPKPSPSGAAGPGPNPGEPGKVGGGPPPPAAITSQPPKPPPAPSSKAPSPTQQQPQAQVSPPPASGDNSGADASAEASSILLNLSRVRDSSPTARPDDKDDDKDDRDDEITTTVTVVETGRASMSTGMPQGIAGRPPPPPPPPPPRQGLSQGTEHLLIAAGSIGATLVLVMVIWIVFMMRKKGMTLRDLVHYRQFKARKEQEEAEKENPRGYDPPAGYEEPASRSPYYDPAVSRQGSSASERPLLARSNTGLRLNTTNTNINTLTAPPPSYDPNTRSFFNGDDAKISTGPAELPDNYVYPRTTTNNNYNTTLSPIQGTMDSSAALALAGTTNSPHDISPVDNRPAPTFRQFLANRRVSNPPKVSRFSWTNSQGAQTPKDPRFSVATSNRSSVPRFRTVESWVGSQARRMEKANGNGSGNGDREERGMSMFPVPDVPKEYINEPSAPAPLRVISRKGSASSAAERERLKESEDEVAALEADEGRKGYMTHMRRDTSGAASDATVFRHHPGTEVKLPRGSRVPSEVLNSKVAPPSL